MRRIAPSELKLDQPLPWDLYDEQGNLLLKQGYVLALTRHISAVIARGAFVVDDVEPTCLAKNRNFSEIGIPSLGFVEGQLIAPALAPVIHALSPMEWPASEPVFIRMQHLANALKQLHAYVLAGKLDADLLEQIKRIAQALMDACGEDDDALLAALHLEREQPYLVVQQLLGMTLVELVAREQGCSDAMRLSLACAALTRDFGQLQIQSKLDKQDGGLTREQLALVQTHPDRSVVMLLAMGVTDHLWIDFVHQHHERWDGSGYPNGLCGDDIAYGARLLGIADSYAAMVTPRVHRPGFLPKEALKILFLERERLYDDALVQQSIKAITMHPPGSLAMLSSAELAVVHRRKKQDQPMALWCLYDQAGVLLSQPQPRTAYEPSKDIVQTLRMEECLSAMGTLKRLWGGAPVAMT